MTTPPNGSPEKLSLSNEGIWLSDGEEITHQKTAEAFSKSIKKDDQGYFIQIGKETKRIEVEDTAFFVTRIEGAPSSGFEITLSDQTKEPLDIETLRLSEGRLVCKTSAGEEARFLRMPYYELLIHTQKNNQDRNFLESGTKKVFL